jgi:starvation-inducible DNA-binding protein
MTTLRTESQAIDELRDTPIGLPGEARRAVIAELQAVLADHIALYLLYKKHHWTLSGPWFRELHLLFDEHADAVLEDSDPVAERISTLGGVPIGAPSQVAEHAGVREAPAGAIGPRAMLEALVHANEGVVARVRRAIGVADEHGDAGSSDLLTSEILREREKEAWFLSAHLRDERL